MANNKVQLSDGTVLLDLTGDTVTPQTLLSGVTAHNAAGEPIVGAVVDSKGNCEIYYGSYVGNSSNTTTTMIFPHKPYVVMACGHNDYSMIAWRGQRLAPYFYSQGSETELVSWADRSVTWANGDNSNLNYTGFTHQVIALLAADE